MIYGSVVASFCCEGFGLNTTIRATRKAIEKLTRNSQNHAF